MPLSKYHIRNEYGLADPELYRSADRDDPEALLEAVAMSGLVGLLRQLGDLAEFAAEIFHDLHEEVMVTAARGHGLMTRVQQLEAEVPSLEKAFFSQTHHSSFFTNGGVDWHPNLRSEQNLVTQGDLPRFVMDSYEECRGPPRLFLLDKFDVAGAGACLKRYTDPSFFRMESTSYGTAAEVHREKRIRKFKKKGARFRDGESPNVVPSHAKLHQLLLEERIENGYTDPARLVKLKKRQLNGSADESKSGKSYMAKFMETPSPDRKMIYETSIIPLPVKLTSDDTSEAGIKTLEVSCISPVKQTSGNKSPNEQESYIKSFSEMDGKANGDIVKVKEQGSAGVMGGVASNHPELLEETDLTADEQKKTGGIIDGYHSDDVTSEVDNYMDALTTMESELETDNECKPKNSPLNIQKVTDANGKEEHHLESRLSYSQSFGDSSTSDDSLYKQDRNEDHIEAQAQLSDSHSLGTSASDNNSSFRRDGDRHIEMQAHFSDTRSVGNSSISDDNTTFKKDRSYFHHSNSSSSMVENIQSEPMPFTNTKYYEPEVKEYTPSDQIPQVVEFQHPDCVKFVTHDDAHAQDDEVSDSGKASHNDAHVQEDVVSNLGQASYDLMTSERILKTDHSASPVDLPARTQSIETSSDPVELNLRLEDDEYRISLVESTTAEPVSLSIVEDNACPVDSSDKNSLDNLDDSDPYAHSEDLVHVSSNLELSHENECSDHSEKFQAEPPTRNSCEGLVGRDIGSAGEDPNVSSIEELDLNSGTRLVLDSQNSKEECISATQFISEDLTPNVEIPPASFLARELLSDSTDNNPQDELSPAEIGVVYSEETPEVVHDGETRSTCSDDPVEGDGHFKHPSSPNNHVMVSDVVTEDVQSEDQAQLTIPYVKIAEKDVGVVTCQASDLNCPSSRSLPDLQELPSGSSSSTFIEKVSNEAELPQISMDMNSEKRENQLKSLVDISSLDIGCSPMIDCTKMEESLYTDEDPHEKEMEVNDAVAGEWLTELEEQKIVDQPEIASAGVQLNLNESVASVLSDSERCNNIKPLSPREKSQHSAFVDELEMVPDFSGIDGQQSESIVDGQNDPLQNGRDGFSPSPCNQLQSESDLELFSLSHVGEVDREFLPCGEENSASEKSQSQQMQPYKLEEESTRATSEFSSEYHADETPSSHSLPESSSQEVYPTESVIGPLKPILPDVIPVARVNNLDEMPPMPPLPPMQWRMGKVQQSSLVSQREEVEVSQASVQPMLPSVQPMLPIISDRKPQFGLPNSERETLLYHNPFVPVMAVENDQLQHSSGFPVGVSGHPVAIPFQFPIMVSDARGQYNYVALDRSQIQNPFLTLPMVTTGRPPHGYDVASEEEMAQNSSLYPLIPPSEVSVPVNDSIPQQEKLMQPPNQLMTDTMSEVKTLEQPINNVVSVVVTPMPPEECAISGHDSISPHEEPNEPLLMTKTSLDDRTLLQSTSNVVSTERPPHDNVAASEGEIVQSSNPCPPKQPAEGAVSEDDFISPQEKPAHSSNQLMTEASEVETLDQSKSNAVGGQGYPSISLMLPPNMESMEPNQSFLPSEGESALSWDASALTSDYESERINGKPKNKLPRPRNPLIDAVAAHDKSKLRKVTERVMPEVAPKLDERDSLLEQIRTKSFNLKPTVSTRPSIQGPKTNLKLAAILEKANAIRQALAGSDEDDDADSWSDS